MYYITTNYVTNYLLYMTSCTTRLYYHTITDIT